MKWIKKNKYTVLVIVVFVVFVLAGIKAMELFFPNEGKALYGNRLDGISAVKISSSKLEQIEATMKEETYVTKVTSDVRGRLVNFIITVNDDCSVEQAKALAPKTIEKLEEEQKKYYDFQVLIQKEKKEANDFPIIGYRHHKKTDFQFTKDREVSAE